MNWRKRNRWPAIRTTKTKFIFFRWLSFYFTSSESKLFKNYSASKLFYFCCLILIKITENMKYVAIDTYTDIAWTFSLTISENEYTEIELGKFDSVQKYSLVWRT